MRHAAYAIRHTWWALVFGIARVVTAQRASPRADQQDSESVEFGDDRANDDESTPEAISARIRSHLTRDQAGNGYSSGKSSEIPSDRWRKNSESQT